MGSVLANPTITKRRATTVRQKQYLNARKHPERGRNNKSEQQMQIDLCDWIRLTLPGVHFRSDTASGAFSSKYEKNIHNRQQSSSSEPDLTILAARRGYHGLVLELKAEGVSLKMKRDGRTIRVYKDAKGRIIGRDYKVRKKGDWASLHIENQYKCMIDYKDNWSYCASFAVGIEEAKKIISWYFDIPYLKTVEAF